MAVPLIEGIIRPLVADTQKARALFPEIVPLSYRQSIEFALEKVESLQVETRWSTALGDTSFTGYEVEEKEGMIREVRTLKVNASANCVFEEVSSLGGDRGWLFWNFAWNIRGFLDRCVGGPGLRRGRRHPREAFVGESIDFWRVEKVEAPKLLRLRAEMKVPGKAWIEWDILPEGDSSKLIQTAYFAPKGLWGLMYWYILYPIHRVIFSGLVSRLREQIEEKSKNDLLSSQGPG
jgi:hypothetical protein